ncbi:MAG: AMP-binding protein [Cyanobacteriota bacterium]|nr:AMP-binding protein [Cyanobacteriota bacterium]
MNDRAPSHPTPLDLNDRASLKQVIDYNDVPSLPRVWEITAQRFPEAIALWDPHGEPVIQLSFAELLEKIRQFAAGLQTLGVAPVTEGDPPRIALIADNSPRWFVADQGIMAAGGADVVRSASADPDELLYILQNSGSSGLVVENLKTLKKLRARTESEFPFNPEQIRWVILLSDEDPPADESLKILNYTQLMAAGVDRSVELAQYSPETLGTLLYTSGTTGRPKGVRLSHANLMHQLSTIGAVLQPQPGDRILSILPTWHSFGRTADYFFLSQGATGIYTNIRYIKNDLKEYKPQYMTGVPRLWESIYEGVQKRFREQPEGKQKLVNFFLGMSAQYISARRIAQGLVPTLETPSSGQKAIATLKSIALAPLHAIGERLVYKQVRQATGGQLTAVLSGGGSLAMHLEDFFEIVGLDVIVGYGLTETAPVLTGRRTWGNLRGSAGKPLPATELQIVDPETRQALPTGERGLVLARGPQVMAGYYNNPEATQKAIDSQGWFDTGDLGLLTPNYDLVLTGRAKDTIVLTNGENIEPQPIEDACIRSPFIDQVMLVGQDEKQLGALVVPNLEVLQKWATQQGMAVNPDAMPPVDIEAKAVQKLFRDELTREVKNRPGYRLDDRIATFRLILEPFSIENGLLTQTLKTKRPVVRERYREAIVSMFQG